MKGTLTEWPAAFAAVSIAAAPPSTIKSAIETGFLKFTCMVSRADKTFCNCSGWFTSQSFCGASRRRAPLAPPRLSEPRKVEAEAQAVETKCDIDRPVPMMVAFRSAISAASRSALPAGIGSCQIKSSAGTSGPLYKTFGPISRCVSLNHARAKASAKASGLAWKCREIFS